MKAMYTKIATAILCLSVAVNYAQINRNVNTGDTFNKNMKEITGTISINKISDLDYKNIKVSQVSSSNTPKIVIPRDYMSKPGKKTWKITPARAFGTGNLGLTVWSGQLWKSGFIIERDFVNRNPVLFVANIDFDARSGKEYIVSINSRGAGSSSYIYSVAGGTVKVYGQDGSYKLLVRAQQSGKMTLPISARHKVGGNERYPETFQIQDIVINEL